MNVLLSIKPKYVDEILNGTKKYEFRKVVFKNTEERVRVFIYSSAPVKKVVASFLVEKIIQDHPQQLWERFKDFAGVQEGEFFSYFGERENGFAIKIKDLEVFATPLDPKKAIEGFSPPQSFCYLRTELDELMDCGS